MSEFNFLQEVKCSQPWMLQTHPSNSLHTLKTHQHPSVTFPTLIQQTHRPSSWCAWLSSPAPPAAVCPDLPACRTPAPSCGCGWAPRGAAGAPGPSGNPAGSQLEGALAGGARRRRNTAPASTTPGRRSLEICAELSEIYLFIALLFWLTF